MRKLLHRSSKILLLLSLYKASLGEGIAKPNPEAGSILRLHSNLNLPDRPVNGKVVSVTGEPLPGVTVLLKNTQIGTNTDPNGQFSLQVPDNGGTLVLTIIGYQTKEVAIPQGSNPLNITLAEDAKVLNEVVVVGYGTQKKSDLTGSVSSLKSEDLNPGVNASVDQLMQGRATGVQITQSSSEPGGGVSVRIRGASSLNAGNEPLY
ncbi:MAG: carboxypeptidase-like regulatory domain-containing protein, partial [Bacteroidota bacterium]|nr:carboxypeptidase-like regulatory domain-containing protein [Bacteroidota bacterium]